MHVRSGSEEGGEGGMRGERDGGGGRKVLNECK